MEFLIMVGQLLADNAMHFAALAALFTLLARFFAIVPQQKLLREGWRAALGFWFVVPLIMLPIGGLLLALMLMAIYGPAGSAAAADWLLQEGRAPFNGWPLWVQALCVLLLGDIYQYWVHRLYHGQRFWKWHAIHHLPREMDWLTSAHFHPVNLLFYVTLHVALIKLIGFAPETFAYLAVFNLLYSGLVHANLDWSFGKLRYVLASPIFHRWHHTHPDEGGNKNFAPTFAFLDVIFGTFYMPPDKKPLRLGIAEPVPQDDFIAQLLWPFRR